MSVTWYAWVGQTGSYYIWLMELGTHSSVLMQSQKVCQRACEVHEPCHIPCSSIEVCGHVQYRGHPIDDVIKCLHVGVLPYTYSTYLNCCMSHKLLGRLPPYRRYSDDPSDITFMNRRFLWDWYFSKLLQAGVFEIAKPMAKYSYCRDSPSICSFKFHTSIEFLHDIYLSWFVTTWAWSEWVS